MGETQSATIPFTAGSPAVVQMTLAHEHPLVLQMLRLLANGESIPVRVGAAAQVSDHWQVVATFEVRLATDDYTILELVTKSPRERPGG